MTTLENIILNALCVNDPASMSVDEIAAVSVIEVSTEKIRETLNSLYGQGLVEPIRVHPPSPGYFPDAKLTDAGRNHHSHALAEGEDHGDISDHLKRGGA
jgi:hypothetical protein